MFNEKSFPTPENTAQELPPEFNLSDYNLDEKVDTEHGLTNRIKSTIQKHWSKSLPLIHITNSEVNWGPGTPIKSTGFVESITATGLNKLSNVGFVPPEGMAEQIKNRFANKGVTDLSYVTEEQAKSSPRKFLEAVNAIRKEFIHHGLRTNKNKVNGKLSIPGVVLLENKIKKQAGDDSPIHAQTNEAVRPEQVVVAFQFDPEDIARSYMETGKNAPSAVIKKADKKDYPFRVEFSSDAKTYRNNFLKQCIEGMAKFRLVELKALYDSASDLELKSKVALAAHDLVDIYVLSPEDFDHTFTELDVDTKSKIEARRKTYNLLGDYK